jgi:hypothetical protein
MKYKSALIVINLSVVLITTIASSLVFADNETPKYFIINFESAFPIRDLKAQIILDLGDKNIPPVVTSSRQVAERNIADNLWEARVFLAAEDYQYHPQVFLTGTLENGEVFTTPVADIARSVELDDSANINCGRSKKDIRSLSTDSLALLVEIRKSKAIILRDKLRRQLSPEVSVKIQKEELGRALKYNRSISTDIPLSEIAYRLTAIKSLP